MELVRGVRILRYEVVKDGGDDLISFEHATNLPFFPRRTFVIVIKSSDSIRGGHANSCSELLVAVSGSVIVDVDNGTQYAEVCLNTRDKALWIKPGIVVKLRNAAPQTVILAVASKCYAETLHFDRPQPHMIDKEETA
jgi:hypothetical protein